MALTTETGTGSSDSESYASVADADSRLSLRGLTLWATMTTGEKEQALRRSTDYMVQTYRNRWKGRRVLITQALDWPRVGVVLEDYGSSQGRNNYGSYGLFQVSYIVVPAEVRNACIDMALNAAAGELSPELDRPTTSETVGPISVTYAIGSRQTVKYVAIDDMLAPLLVNNGSGLKLQRA